jgi:hypothetical protein
MPKGSEYRIKKLEKGPLQRFKNQNLLIKKFGEVGIQIYKAITGKRTTAELRKDLGVDQALFDQVVTYMVDAGMVELEPTAGGEAAPKAQGEAEIPAEEEKPSRPLEEISPEEEIGQETEVPPLEEKPRAGKKKKEEFLEESKVRKPPPKEEEFSFEEEVKPVEGGGELELEKPSKPKKKAASIDFEEEIKPVSEEELAGPPPEEEKPPEEPEEEEQPPEEEKPEEEMEISAIEEEEKVEEGPELSPVEKIISDKYGDIGLRVYALIDGQRTAEEIMRETGLTEPKLVEILDFMDEQGIIKLDYPKSGGPSPGMGGPAPSQSFGGGPSYGPQQMAPPPGAKKEELGFVPMIEGEESLDEARAVLSPVEMPIKAPLDFVKGVQLKTKLMFKFKENKGGKVFEQIDGKNDVIDIALKLDLPLYEIADILRFMLENGMVLMKPLTRTDVRKKYGDDGYSVYKKFGKEGLMLYELIGKELTIKQMAEKITTDKAKIIDMFIFIHKVLGIELPIDRDVLAKQLGL